MITNELNKACRHLSKHDQILKPIIKKYGYCNLQPKNKYFNALIESIISQQLSGASANAIINKFKAQFNGKITPEKVLNTSIEKLRAIGLSNAKANYIIDLSDKVYSKTISFRGIKNKSNEEIIELLTQVKGIGIWTVHMFLIFTLGRLNVLPVGDLGIRKGIMLNYGLKKLPDEKTMLKIAANNKWHPYEAIASWYMWKSLDNR
jgi:DNA-3-methyladenine glycosylase II